MYIQEKNEVFYCKWDIFKEVENLIAVFSTRKGGHSEDYYYSLNLGLTTDDKKENVIKNREKFFHTIDVPESRIAKVNQVHKDEIIIVNIPGRLGNGDGLITNINDIFLCGSFADCVSIVVIEQTKKAIGLFHVGWRNLALDMPKKGIEKICRTYDIKSCNLLVGIGPHIKRCCYVIQNDVAKYFDQKFLKKNSKECFNLDMESVIIEQLINSDVKDENIERSDFCTSCNKDLFFSHRRDKCKTGRMMAVIGIKE